MCFVVLPTHFQKKKLKKKNEATSLFMFIESSIVTYFFLLHFCYLYWYGDV